MDHKIAIIIPCYNEGLTITDTIVGLRATVPDADIFVYDNNSKDDTIALAKAAGAKVFVEKNQGKGNVVRRMFSDIEADVYLLVDGDNTYDANSAPELLRLVLEEGMDFVNGARRESSEKAYRAGHKFGNWMLTSMIRKVFGAEFSDMLSGLKCFSRRYVKSFPALSRGFEIETELTTHALELRMPCFEITTPYGERPEGSVSKLRTYRDGFRILITIIKLVKEERPLQLFASIGAVLMLLALAIMVPVAQTYIATGLVPRLPTAILAIGLTGLAGLSLVMAVIMDSVVTMRREMKRIAYLQIPMFKARRDR
jgi:glycosyltransferase involved in cell wall biosynthesis